MNDHRTIQNKIVDIQNLANFSKSSLLFTHAFIFSELIEIMRVLLGGVHSGWVQRGYNASLVLDNYNKLYSLWRRIDRHLKLQDLRIGEFNEFLHLDTEFDECVKRWQITSKGYWDDIQLLKRQLPLEPFPIPEDLEKLLEETEQALNLYQNQKEYLQERKSLEGVYVFYYIVFNYQNGTFLYQGKSREFQSGISDFQFLKILLDSRGKIVRYDEIYKAMNKKEISTIDPKDEIKQIRKNLRKQLLFLDISPVETDFMLSKIIAKTNLGYIIF